MCAASQFTGAATPIKYAETYHYRPLLTPIRTNGAKAIAPNQYVPSDTEGMSDHWQAPSVRLHILHSIDTAVDHDHQAGVARVGPGVAPSINFCKKMPRQLFIDQIRYVITNPENTSTASDQISTIPG